MPWRRLLPVALISFALGGLFGSTEVVTVAFADSLGDKAIAGVLLALWALGSLRRRRHHRRGHVAEPARRRGCGSAWSP